MTRRIQRTSLIEGFARLIDITGSLNSSRSEVSGPDCDSKALQSDWEKVGQDIFSAIEKYEQNTSTNEK